MRGSGPNIAQTTNVIAATSTTAGTKYEATRSARCCTGARLRCASLTMRTICASKRFAAHALGAHHEAAGAVHGSADHAAFRRFFDGDRFAGHQRFID